MAERRSTKLFACGIVRMFFVRLSCRDGRLESFLLTFHILIDNVKCEESFISTCLAFSVVDSHPEAMGDNQNAMSFYASHSLEHLF
jgi:hypothetical protein